VIAFDEIALDISIVDFLIDYDGCLEEYKLYASSTT
jgi:hypothetical protein